MNNLGKKSFYAGMGLLLTSIQSAHAATNFGQDKVKENLKGSTESADGAIQTIVGNLMGFLGILALGYLLWGGFTILTAGGEEEKVNNGKKIIIQAAIGLGVIFLANSILSWLIDFILT